MRAFLGRAARSLARPGARKYGQVLLTTEQSALAPLAPETAALLKEAEGPWGAMSAENKQLLYRAIYKTTRAEMIAEANPNDGMFVFGGVVTGVLAGWGLFQFIATQLSSSKENYPSTAVGHGFDLDHSDETKAKQAERGLNPQKGYGSAEWKAASK